MSSRFLHKPESRAAERKDRKRAKALQWRRVRACVLVRDGGRCRVCKTRDGVDVHHIQFRSRGGEDSTENCAALCRECHAEIHAYRLTLSGNANGKLKMSRVS